MNRFGVSFKISLGIGIIVAVTLVAGVTALFTLQSLRTGYRQIAEFGIPSLVESGKMLATVRTLEAQGIAMVAAPNAIDVTRIHNRAMDLQEVLRTGMAGLITLYEQDRYVDKRETGIATISQIESGLDLLNTNFSRLKTTVEARIEAERIFNESFQQLLESGGGSNRFVAHRHLVHDQEHSDQGRAWLSQQTEIISQLSDLHLLHSQPRLRGVEKTLNTLLANADQKFDTLPADEKEHFQSLRTSVTHALQSPEGPLKRRQKLLALEASQKGLLSANQHITTLLVSRVADLFDSEQHQMSMDNQRFDKLASDRSSLMILLSVTSLVMALVIVGYLHHSVLQRLYALKNRMLSSVRQTGDGDDGPKDFLGDEITEIGNVLDHFYNQIQEREQSLRKARDEAEQLAVRAEAANRAKSTFLANMSHELRTPLNAIIGFSEIIKAGMRKGHEAEYADDIHQSGTHLLNLINGILELSKIEAGKHELDHDIVDIQAITQDVQRFFNIPVREKQITLTSEFDEDCVLRADEMAVKQILVNLISNAVKFTRDEGEIKIIGSKDDPYYRIEVVDNGVGIAANELEKVLEPFHQEKDGYVDNTGGTGLGLTIVRNLVELHGGRIDLKSVKGEGTVVTIHLPLDPTTAAH